MKKSTKKENKLYESLHSKKAEINENVFVRPLDSYETIISAVNYALSQSEAVDKIISDEMEDLMKECEGMANSPVAMPMLYPLLIATYPTFCLFEISDDTYKCSYTYDKATRNVTLGMPAEVTLDVTMKIKPEDGEDD
jgi:hypothetical protein